MSDPAASALVTTSNATPVAVDAAAAPVGGTTPSSSPEPPITGAVLAKRAGFAVLLGALLAAFVIWGPAVCPVRNSVGVPCPGCGLTRATMALLEGDFHAALHFHPLVWLMLPIFVVMVIEEVYIFVRRDRLTLLARIPTIIWWPVGVTILVVWIARFFGAFGGPVDPPDFGRSWLGMLIHWLAG